MIIVRYISVNGGTNNLSVAHDTKTGWTSTSLTSKEHAIRNLKRKLSKMRRVEQKNGVHHIVQL